MKEASLGQTGGGFLLELFPVTCLEPRLTYTSSQGHFICARNCRLKPVPRSPRCGQSQGFVSSEQRIRSRLSPQFPGLVSPSTCLTRVQPFRDLWVQSEADRCISKSQTTLFKASCWYRGSSYLQSIVCTLGSAAQDMYRTCINAPQNTLLALWMLRHSQGLKQELASWNTKAEYDAPLFPRRRTNSAASTRS